MPSLNKFLSYKFSFLISTVLIFMGSFSLSAQNSDCEGEKHKKDKTATIENIDLKDYLSNKTWETTSITQFNSANPDGVTRSSGLENTRMYFSLTFKDDGKLVIEGNSPYKGKSDRWKVVSENKIVLYNDTKESDYILSDLQKKAFKAERRNPLTKDRERITFSQKMYHEKKESIADKSKMTKPEVKLTGILGKSSFGTPTLNVKIENNSEEEITGFMYRYTIYDNEGNELKTTKSQYNKMILSSFNPKPDGESGGFQPGYEGKGPKLTINGLTDGEKQKIAKVKLEFLRAF